MIRQILFFISLLLSIIMNAQESIQDILSNTDCPSLEISGEPEIYIGDDLFSLINGGAELYHEYGFVEVLATQMLIPGADPIKLEIYDMGSPEGAWGIFSMTNSSSSHKQDIGEQARQGEGFLQFIKDRYMVYFYFDQLEQTDLHTAASCLAGSIQRLGEAPLIMDIVKAGRSDAEKTIYFKGNLGLSNVYNFHYKDVFGYKEGAAAIYPDMKVILLNYTSEAECIEGFIDAKEFFMNSSKYHDQHTLRGSFHMKDRKEQQIDCYFENSFLVLFIYSGETETLEIREAIIENMNNAY